MEQTIHKRRGKGVYHEIYSLAPTLAGQMVCKWYWDLRETRLGSFARETTELRVARAAHNYTVMHGATCGHELTLARDETG